MIALRSPKGWTAPKIVDGEPLEGAWRAPQIPVGVSASSHPEHLAQLEQWLRSYRPDTLFDRDGKLNPSICALAPVGERRMSTKRNANGGLLLLDRDLRSSEISPPRSMLQAKWASVTREFPWAHAAPHKALAIWYNCSPQKDLSLGPTCGSLAQLVEQRTLNP